MRRRELLLRLGLPFRVVTPDVSENMAACLDPPCYCLALAERKALAVDAKVRGAAWVLGADTIVVHNGDIMGKPASPEQAVDMLTRLSGESHLVYSAVALVKEGIIRSEYAKSQVVFRSLKQKEIVDYANSTESAGKAGAYAIQGRASAFVTHLVGSYSSVVGLPLAVTLRLLSTIGIEIPE